MESGITDGHEFNCFGFEWNEIQIWVVREAGDVFLNKLEAFGSRKPDDRGEARSYLTLLLCELGCIAWVGI